MERLEEVNLKHDKLRALLEEHKADALLLRRVRNIAWVTAGADASIVNDTDYGVYSILITADKRSVVTNNIEAPRIHAEDKLEDLGFETSETPWHAAGADMPENLVMDEGDVELSLQQLRLVLTDSEKDRLRALGKDAAAALEEACRALQPRNSEHQIAAIIASAARKRGGVAIVNLVATDERIEQFRHPLPTAKRLDKYAMLVMCMRREGLITSTTRLVHLGAAPDEVKEKIHKVAAIDAAVIAATKPGRTLGDVFADLQSAYAAQGEADQWQFHHQGGSAGYTARERIATPGDPTPIVADQVFAWNPSIVGAKSEDTILLGADGFEIVTQASEKFPQIEIEVDGQKIMRPGLMES